MNDIIEILRTLAHEKPTVNKSLIAWYGWNSKNVVVTDYVSSPARLGWSGEDWKERYPMTPMFLAQVADACLVRAKRDNGSEFLKFRKETPESIYEAFGPIAQVDDFRYEFLETSLTLFGEVEEWEDDALERSEPEPEIYTSNALRWLAADCNHVHYVDEFRSEFGSAESVTQEIIGGMWLEQREVHYAVRATIESLFEETEMQLLNQDVPAGWHENLR